MSSKKSSSKEEPPLCFICLEPFTKQPNRKPVICPHCPSTRSEPACVRCIEHYISTSVEDPHCPSCRKAWTYDYICENFPKTWYNGEFKKQREAILMDRERSRLPEAQGWAERIRHAYTNHKLAIIELRRRECELRNRSATILCERNIFLNNHSFKVVSGDAPPRSILLATTLKEFDEKLNAIERELRQLDNETSRMGRVYHNMLNMSDQELQQHQDYDRIREQVRAENPNVDRVTEETLIQSIIATIDYKKGPARSFIMKCPGADCRGFLSTAYKCGICLRSTCAHCLIQYPMDNSNGEGHVCSEDDKKTVELIKKSCRNCPSCGMSIYRIEGCNQMFCTACNTAFDWASGQILNTRQIHNPHYTDYLRRSGGTTENAAPENYNPCNQNQNMSYNIFSRNYYNPIHYVIDYIFYREKGDELTTKRQYLYNVNHAAEIYRLCIHIRMEEIRDLQAKVPTTTMSQKLNAEYLAGKKSQEEWKEQIMKNDIARLAYNEAIQSLQAFDAVCGDVYANFIHRYNETLSSIPVELRPSFTQNERDYNQNVIRKWIKKNGNTKVFEVLDSFIEHYKQLTLETKELVNILNTKMEAIIKTYKVKLNCYTERIQLYVHIYYDSKLSSYTGLQNKQRASRISQRPAPTTGGAASASASAEESSDYDTEDE